MPSWVREGINPLLPKMNIEHRTLNIERPMKDRPPYLFPLNIRYSMLDVGRSMFDVHLFSFGGGVYPRPPINLFTIRLIFSKSSVPAGKDRPSFRIFPSLTI